MKKSTPIFIKTTLLILLISVASCKKFLDVGPPKTAVVSALVFDNDATATSALLSIYGDWMSTSQVSFPSLDLAQSSDECVGYANPPAINYYTNSLMASSNDDFWTYDYKYIYRANAVLDGLNGVNEVSPAVQRQLRGEALFIRAFFHFYLVNLFGDVPYIATTDYKTTSSAAREPVAQVYQKIIADLKQAKGLLTDNFPGANNLPSVERVRPNRGAVHAMLARVYLYNKDWSDAKLEADSVISNTTNYSLVTDLNSVFLKNSREAVWQLQPSSPVYTNGYDGTNFILTGPPNIGQPAAMSNQLYNAFEAGDKRKANWTGTLVTTGVTAATYHYAYKYKQRAQLLATTEYLMVLRLAEQYLIRAEAKANLNDIAGAVADLNLLRARARNTATDLPDYPATLGANACLAAIAHERQVELFTEWGHRWLDLKRTGQADTVLGPLKGTNWQTTDQLFPIPQGQINLDPNLTHYQNPGY